MEVTLEAGRPAVSVPYGDAGGLCRKGWTAARLLQHPERLRAPLVRDRRGAPLREASFEEAMDMVAAALAATRSEHGPDAVGIFGGGGLTNEKAYYLGKLARVAIGTRCIDYNGRYCMSSAATALNRSFGMDRGLPFPLADLAHSEVIMLVGSNIAETMPLAQRHLIAQREAGGSLVVVDPRRTPTAEAATVHLQSRPGTDLVLANGLLHILIEEQLVSSAYVEARTTGADLVEEAVAPWWPERVEAVTGVAVPELRAAARLLGHAKSAAILTGRGAEQHAQGTATVSGLINLALALGLPGRAYSGFGTLTGQGNGQGGREHGQKADQLPGYRSLTDPAARSHVASVWGVDPDSLPGPGPSATEMLSLLGQPSGVRSLLVMGSNPAVSAPRSTEVRRSLAALDFLVVADPFVSETAALADVVLPCAQWAEETGTMTNAEGRVLLRRRRVAPPEGVATDLEIIAGIAARLGHGRRFSSDPEEVFEELRLASAGGLADYGGISYERITAEGGVFWPCPTVEHPGTPRLFREGFATADGRARFVPVGYEGASEPCDEPYPVVLTTGRALLHYQSGTQTRRVPELAGEVPEAYVEMHPLLAARVGLSEGGTACVSTRRGRVNLAVRLTESIRSDTVFVPFHWGGAASANILTNPVLDPSSKMPAFKACAAAVSAP